MTTERWVDIGDGIQIPAEVGSTSETGEYTATISATYDPGAGRYVTSRLVIEAAGEHEVTGEMIRGIRVGALLRLATESSVLPYIAQARHPHDLAASGPTAETLRQVAVIYRLALLLGDGPTQRVADTLSVPRSTAARWVTRARDRGYLTVTDPRAGRKG